MFLFMFEGVIYVICCIGIMVFFFKCWDGDNGLEKIGFYIFCYYFLFVLIVNDVWFWWVNDEFCLIDIVLISCYWGECCK